MKTTNYFISSILIALLFLTACSKSKDNPSPEDNPDPIEEEDDRVRMTFTSAKDIGELVGLMLIVDESEEDEVWVDINNNKVQDEGEAYKDFTFGSVSFNLVDKTVSIYGNVLRLILDNNPLTAIDVSRNPALKSLFCSNTQLTSLDLTKNVNLIELVCDNNELTSLDLSKNLELIRLKCDRNKLKSLDLSNNLKLTEAHCHYNQLTSLKLGKGLETLYCYNNQLTSLDLTNNLVLKTLVCMNNKITQLDLKRNKYLEILNCANNQIQALDFSRNPYFKNLICDLNHIKQAEMLTLINSLVDRSSLSQGTLRTYSQDAPDEDNFPLEPETITWLKNVKNWNVVMY